MDQVNSGYNRVVGLAYALVSEVSEIVYQSDGKAVISFVGDTGWRTIYNSKPTIQFKEAPDRDSGGWYYEQEYSGHYPGESDEDAVDIDALNGVPVVVRLEYLDGRARLVGDFETPVRLRFESSDSNGVGSDVTFKRKSKKRSSFLFES